MFKKFFVYFVFLVIGYFIGSLTAEWSFTNKNLSKDKFPDAEFLFKTVNNWRRESGYAELQMSESLCNVARVRIKEIKVDFSHTRFSESIFPEEFVFFGENLSEQLSQEDVFGMWLNSPTHRENLERDFTHSCVRCEESYCVQIFAK